MTIQNLAFSLLIGYALIDLGLVVLVLFSKSARIRIRSALRSFLGLNEMQQSLYAIESETQEIRDHQIKELELAHRILGLNDDHGRTPRGGNGLLRIRG